LKLSAILEPMIAAGVPGDVILATVKAFEEQQSDALERRRANDRERQERRRHVKSREVTVTVSSHDASVARGEDNLQTKDTSGKEEKKVASPSARPSRGSRIPDDFQPDIDAAVSEGVPRIEAERQARSFCDYWRAKPGAGGLKLDWPATWRVWYRRNISPPPKPQATAPPSHMAEVNSILDRIVQGESNAPQHGNQTIDGSYARTDRGGAANLVQFDAVATRYRS